MDLPIQDLLPGDQAHCRRTAEISKRLAEWNSCPATEVKMITQSALYHDIGKTCIPAMVLHKPGPLTSQERALVQTHTTIGAEILADSCGTMHTASIVALQHHERLDGSGYLGLHETEIHPHAKLVAVADIFDALLSPRSYKAAWSIYQVCGHLDELSGVQLDKTIVTLLLKNIHQVLTIYHHEIHISDKMRIYVPYAHRERREHTHVIAGGAAHYPLADRVWSSAKNTISPTAERQGPSYG